MLGFPTAVRRTTTTPPPDTGGSGGEINAFAAYLFRTTTAPVRRPIPLDKLEQYLQAPCLVPQGVQELNEFRALT